MFKYDVLCVGSATVDTFLTIDQTFSSVRLGDKVLAKNIEKHSGGGSTNSAAALAKLGLKVRTLTKLGDDHDADFVLRELKDYKIKNICLKRSKKNTDSAVILSSLKDRDRVIYVHKGASTDLSWGDFKDSQLNARWVYVATLTGKSLKMAHQLAKFVEKKKIKMLFNPSLYLAKKGKNYLKNILKNTTILVLNKEEAQALLKMSLKSFPSLLKELRKCGPEIVVITNGRKGLYALHEGTMYYSNKTPDVKIIHTAGAGDAFTSGFLAGVMKKYPLEEALKLGQVNSSSVIQHIGTKNKLLTIKEAKQMMKKYKIKITRKKI